MFWNIVLLIIMWVFGATTIVIFGMQVLISCFTTLPLTKKLYKQFPGCVNKHAILTMSKNTTIVNAILVFTISFLSIWFGNLYVKFGFLVGITAGILFSIGKASYKRKANALEYFNAYVNFFDPNYLYEISTAVLSDEFYSDAGNCEAKNHREEPSVARTRSAVSGIPIDPETAPHYWAEPEGIIAQAETVANPAAQQKGKPSGTRKFKIALVVLGAMCAALAVGVFVLSMSLVSEKQRTEETLLRLKDTEKERSVLAQQLEEMQPIIAQMDHEKRILRNERDVYSTFYETQKQQYNDLSSEYWSLTDSIGYVFEGVNYYHHMHCDLLNGKSYWIYNIEACESFGYAPCENCWY